MTRVPPDERVKQLCTTARRHLDAYENERQKWYHTKARRDIRDRIAGIHRNNYNKTIDKLAKLRPDRYSDDDKL